MTLKPLDSLDVFRESAKEQAVNNPSNTLDEAEIALVSFAEKWGAKYLNINCKGFDFRSICECLVRAANF